MTIALRNPGTLVLGLAVAASLLELGPLVALLRDERGILDLLIAGLAYQVGNAAPRPVAVSGRYVVTPVAVIAAGTGLGLSCYLPGAHARVVASEAGHATLAAADAGDAAILDRLRQRFGHVSAERVLSGGGLVNLRAALAVEEGHEPASPTPEEVVRGAIYGSAGDGAALDYFCDFLGSFAGDMALTFAARGGVLIGGGIAPHILPVLVGSAFRERFAAKGRFADYVGQIPTAVIVRPEPTFLGLAALASRGDG